MSFPAYPAYKDSGVEWLGEVPAHWEEKPFFSLISERSVSNAGMKQDNLLSLSYGRIITKDINTLDGLLPVSFETYQVVYPGDIVFRLTDLQNDKRSLRSAIVREVGIITSAYLAGACRKILPEFASHLFRAYDTLKVFYSMGGGLRQSMKYSDMKWLPILLPNEQEQAKIARFLDHETIRIDALIEEQQRLIELLKEKRQAVISHAVTKGLDPTVPMKDSGVEWLGEVPAHWEVKPLRYVSTMIDGDRSSAYPSEGDLVGEGIPFVSSKNIVGYKFTDKNLNYITQEKFNSLGRGKLCDGDLAITVRGTIGHVAVFDSAVIGNRTGFINAQMMIIRPHAGLTEYIRLCSESFFWQKQLDVAAYGSTVKQLSNPIVGGVVIALPPRAEIPALTSKVRALESEFETLISEALMGTSLLQERRSALISAAVTGKIDVRGWQPPASAPTPELVQEAV